MKSYLREDQVLLRGYERQEHNWATLKWRVGESLIGPVCVMLLLLLLDALFMDECCKKKEKKRMNFS